MTQRYYFDHNATTPLAPEVLDAMHLALTEEYGNASSLHHFGQVARSRLDESRRRTATFLGAKPAEIVFTGGGTESDNLAIFGICGGESHGHLITTTVEHPAVLAAASQFPDTTFVPVDGQGLVDPDAIRRALRADTRLISVIHANNELGTIQPIEAIARIAREAGVAFHSDGVQAAGKIPVDVNRLGVDLYSIAAHKIYGPQGMGALFVRKGTKLAPMLFGGSHERKRRAGTENVAGAIGLARATRLAIDPELTAQRDRLEQAVLGRISGVHINGFGAPRIGNTSNFRFDGIDAEPLLIALDLRGFAVSSGSACSSGSSEPSHVLQAIGLTKQQARSSLRVSLGRSNDAAQVEALLEALVECVTHLRKLAPAYA